MQVGPYQLPNALWLAPMAGVTDRPFRQLCRDLGAGQAVAEMISANPALWDTEKTQRRMDHAGESGLRAVQIAGADPDWMAEAARFNAERGAQIIDINMGCPAKKVCHKYAGSALMADLKLAQDIIRAVVEAVDIPVTVKMRTGPKPDLINAVSLAQMAEAAGATLVTVHGRTRDQLYKGFAQHETVTAVKQAVRIPVIANGDIDSPEKAKQILEQTGVDALMIGRAAQGNPWIFREIQHFLETGERLPPPSLEEVQHVMDRHLAQLHSFYGEYKGLRIARKHVGWYLEGRPGGEAFKAQFHQIEDAGEQRRRLTAFWQQCQQTEPTLTGNSEQKAA
ncbi:tRNA dihydrouridine synthase DusB [Permianibacter aggregans]|uniref:tRNA-dihydrouridine synthase B n=1 Tax=Permianibacter aggregans TaxID=1510150 RepID=A0A4V3D805_9GAMM|nr:tRNA dihydrouridine synthase DusB [Permianibacter aggregans]QGX39456.1 tRNA dihydrouridine synthase DusB [Permianibacter aggregans]TDQ49807.1 tRNA-U20-dihydrouridine synthase [Permianibacter aggregans]